VNCTIAFHFLSLLQRLLPFSSEFFVFHFAIQNIKIKTYRNVILSVILYGCVTWCLTLREEHRLRVLRGKLGPKRDGVTGEWRKLHNEELHDLTSSPSVIRVIKKNEVGGVGGGVVM